MASACRFKSGERELYICSSDGTTTFIKTQPVAMTPADSKMTLPHGILGFGVAMSQDKSESVMVTATADERGFLP